MWEDINKQIVQNYIIIQSKKHRFMSDLQIMEKLIFIENFHPKKSFFVIWTEDMINILK